MRIGFAGTPVFAKIVLQSLLNSKHRVLRVFTQPAQRAGRGKKRTNSPVFNLSQDFSIEVHTPTKLKPIVGLFQDLDLLVVAAYGRILPDVILSAPKHGCINVHASLLPRWRGATPIEHAILHGDETTGVSIMRMTKGLDAGPVYHQMSLELTNKCTLASVTTELAKMGSAAVKNTLDLLDTDPKLPATSQEESLVTYAPKLTSEIERIDWTRSATFIDRLIRALDGRGSSYATMLKQDPGLRIAILEAEAVEGQALPGELVPINQNQAMAVGCGQGLLLIKQVRLNRGKGKPVAIRDAMNGYSRIFAPGNSFDSPVKET